ncbi:MAG: hypothetical protein DRI30_01155 [Chloroflexi bacterium]|nr:MAG: hypothetical protein DRI30_01155 [Chloroflexota bacterium]
MTQDNLRDVIGLRMQLAREVLDLAEDHRDEVWERLRSRISGLEDVPCTEAERPAPAARHDGPERRRSPAELMYAGEERPVRRLSWPRLGPAHAAGAALVAVAVAAAAITLS